MMRGGAEDGTKEMKGNTQPDRQVRKIQRTRPQTRYAIGGRRMKISVCKRGKDEAVQNVMMREKAGRESGRRKTRNSGIQP